MHVIAALQITEYSLINNSCMSVQRKTQLRLKEGTMYYQLEEGETAQGNMRLGGLKEGTGVVYSVYEQH